MRYESTVMWDETNRVKDGTIRRDTCFPASTANGFCRVHTSTSGIRYSKHRARVCTRKDHYDPLDLTNLPANNLPRTNYVPACDRETYASRDPPSPWGGQERVTTFYRLSCAPTIKSGWGAHPALRRLLPQEPAHPSSDCANYSRHHSMCCFAGLTTSLLFDFFVKTTGRTNLCEESVAASFRYPKSALGVDSVRDVVTV